VNGTHIQDIAWYYPEPKSKAENIKGYVAFYKVTYLPKHLLTNLASDFRSAGGF
jgi:uncharacterized protein (DUF427 family)